MKFFVNDVEWSLLRHHELLVVAAEDMSAGPLHLLSIKVQFQSNEPLDLEAIIDVIQLFLQLEVLLVLVDPSRHSYELVMLANINAISLKASPI